MNCKKCGASIADGNRFCLYCGAEVEDPANKNVAPNISFGTQADLPSLEKNEKKPVVDDWEETQQVSCATDYFSRAGSLEDKPAACVPAQPPHRENEPQEEEPQGNELREEEPVLVAPVVYCPYCGAAIVPESKFCSACSRCLIEDPVKPCLTEDCARPSRKKKWIRIGIVAFAACAAVIAGIFLIGKEKHPEPESNQPESYSESTTTEPTHTEAEPDLISSLCGDWYAYSGEKTDSSAGAIVGAEATELHLESTMEAELVSYVANSDVYASYTGTWSPTILAENSASITLQLAGGYLGLDEQDEGTATPFTIVITVEVAQNIMTVTDTDNAQSPLANVTFERDLPLQEWIDRELSSGTRNVTSEEMHSIYEAFFCENYLATDLVCLADVTHDGIDEMIVVHFCDEMNTEIDGYVYSIDENMQVKEIYSRVGSAFHAGGFFNWYIRETESGFVLASEEGYWGTGIGSLSFHEYYLTSDGTLCEISSVSVSSLDYTTEEEIEDAFNEYSEQVSLVKAGLYTIFSCPQNGYDTDTIAMYPMDPTTVFSVKSLDEAKIIGEWTYRHDMYGAVGIFAFEPDGTGYISIFGNVKYEYTYEVIGDTAFLTIDDNVTICTFERDGDEMYWHMGGETYYLTYRD